MIEVRGLTKRYGDILAVDDLSFDVEPGKVTGFLGPNGAGKSTTMRIMLGLDQPTSGTALVRGRPFASYSEPLREVGALLDPGSVHPGRSGRNHLRVAARTNGVPERRVEEVIDQVGLGGASRRRIKGYSLGMRQRLGGRTVLVSSHLMSEMQQTADRLVVIGRGRLIADARTGDILRGLGHRPVRVRSPQPDLLLERLRERGHTAEQTDEHSLEVEDSTAGEVGDLAHALGIPVHHLSEVEQSLEQAFIDLTSSSVEHHGGRSETETARTEVASRPPS